MGESLNLSQRTRVCLGLVFHICIAVTTERCMFWGKFAHASKKCAPYYFRVRCKYLSCHTESQTKLRSGANLLTLRRNVLHITLGYDVNICHSIRRHILDEYNLHGHRCVNLRNGSMCASGCRNILLCHGQSVIWGLGESCIWDFGGKSLGKETIWKT